MRGKPTVFFEKPTGSSRPSSHGMPKDRKPPGPGRRSAKTRGRAWNSG